MLVNKTHGQNMVSGLNFMTRTQQFIEKNKKVLTSGPAFFNPDTIPIRDGLKHTYVYATWVQNPQGDLRLYVGIHTTLTKKGYSPLWWNSEDGYVGTSGIFQQGYNGKFKSDATSLKDGWDHVATFVVEELFEQDYARERYWIREARRIFGVAPETKPYFIRLGIRKECNGIVLNVQDNSCDHLWPIGKLAPTLTKEALKKRSESLHKTLNGKDLSSRASQQFKIAGRLAASAKDVRQRASVTLHNNKVAKRKRYQLSDGFVGDYIQVSKHLGVHKDSVRKLFSGKYKSLRGVNVEWKEL